MKLYLEKILEIDDSHPMGKGELAAHLYGDFYCDSHRRSLLARYIHSLHLEGRLRKLGLSPNAKVYQPIHLHLILASIIKNIEQP